jgi:hypothetical protein
MTHFQKLEPEQLQTIVDQKFILLRPAAGEVFKEGEPFIFQTKDQEETLVVNRITHSVPGLLKNWIIISLEEKVS